MENKIKQIVEELIKKNKENLSKINDGWDEGYAYGVHDGYLDVLMALGIETNEEYLNQ